MPGFWEKKFAPEPGTQQRQPQRRVDPDLVPRGYGQNPDRAVADYMARQGIHVPGSRQQQPQQEEYYEEGGDDEVPEGHMRALDAVRRFRGKAALAETERCPNCNSNNYFTNERITKINSRTGEKGHASPECFDCGYPREQGMIGIGAKTVGDGHKSRQGAVPTIEERLMMQ